jgi:phosphomethylpyrimidine synthase
MAGADFLCYLTPAEHLGLPTAEEVGQGVIASRIAAHAADIVRLGPRARKWDDEMARARGGLDWEAQYRLAIDSQRARSRHHPVAAGETTCSMCGPYCVYALLGKGGLV